MPVRSCCWCRSGGKGRFRLAPCVLLVVALIAVVVTLLRRLARRCGGVVFERTSTDSAVGLRLRRRRISSGATVVVLMRRVGDAAKLIFVCLFWYYVIADQWNTLVQANVVYATYIRRRELVVVFLVARFPLEARPGPFSVRGNFTCLFHVRW